MNVKTHDKLLFFFVFAKTKNVRASIEYNTGKYMDGHGKQIQEMPGYEVSVDNKSYIDKDGNEIRFWDLDEAVSAGLEILRSLDDEEK